MHWGQSIGVATGRTVQRLLEEQRHPEHGYRACLGLLSLARKYGKPRLEAACLVALELGTARYSHVRDILANGRDRVHAAAPRRNGPARRMPTCAAPATTNEPNQGRTTMMMNTTLEQLRGLRLHGMAAGCKSRWLPARHARHELRGAHGACWWSASSTGAATSKRERLLKEARLKYPQAAIEDLDGRAGRGIDRHAVMSLALGDWIDCGPQRPDHRADRRRQILAGLRAGAVRLPARPLGVYQRVPRLGEELRIRHGNGTFGKWLLQLAKTDVLLLDDWGMAALDAQTRADLLEIIDDRAASKATIITSQLPIEHWHAWVGDATIADAILDRLHAATTTDSP